MRTLYDYIKCYADTSLEKSPWNSIDNMLCAILAYFNFDPVVGEKNIQTICWEISKMDFPKDHWIDAKKMRQCCALVLRGKRYQDAKMTDYVNIVDDKTQFGVITFQIGKIKVISFKGSDGTVIGWYENIKLAYTYPTYSQNLALEYTKKHIDGQDREVYLVGHSKGGNLAMSVGLELGEFYFDRIEKIYNFDGPGFNKEQVESIKYLRLSTKLINVMPKYSYIGCLLRNEGGMTYYVNTNVKGILVHFPNHWEIFGTSFISTSLDNRAKFFNRLTTYGFDSFGREELGEYIEAVFSKLLENKTAMMNVSAKEINQMLESMKDKNLNVSRFFNKIFWMLVTYSVLGKKFRKKSATKDTIEIQNEADSFLR